MAAAMARGATRLLSKAPIQLTARAMRCRLGATACRTRGAAGEATAARVLQSAKATQISSTAIDFVRILARAKPSTLQDPSLFFLRVPLFAVWLQIRPDERDFEWHPDE